MKSELQKVLISNSPVTSFLFEASNTSGGPKEAENWNMIVGALIKQIKEFNVKSFSRNLYHQNQVQNQEHQTGDNKAQGNEATTGSTLRKRTLPNNINPKPLNFDDTDGLTSKIYSEADKTLDVKVYSLAGQPRILSSTMMKPSDYLSTTENSPKENDNDKNQKNGQSPEKDQKKTPQEKLTALAEKIYKISKEKLQNLGQKLHKNVDFGH